MTYHAITAARRTSSTGGYRVGKWGITPTSAGGERAARDGWQVTMIQALPIPSAFVAA